MRYRIWTICALLSVTAGFGPAAAEYPADYDLLAYRLSVVIDFDKNPGPESPFRSLFSVLNTLSAEATLRLRNVSDRPQEEVSLVLHRLMSVSKIGSDGDPLVFEQRLRGLEDQPNFHVHHLSVRWNEPLQPGEEATLTVEYAGQLLGYPETGTLYVLETLDPDFTILRSETLCYPQVALPESDSVLAARRLESFDQEIEVAVPPGHVVVHGGRSTGVREEDGKKIFSFSSYEPASAIVVPIAPYKLAMSGPHRVFHFDRSGEAASRLTENLDRGMSLLSSWFGPLPRARGLTIAEIPELFGSQAGAVILQTSGAFTNPDQVGEFYHELSHLWNPPDVDPKPSRWNEGLAMFLQGLVREKLEGEGKLDRLLSAIFSGTKEQLEKDERLATVAMIDYGEEKMISYSYAVGALLFGLLYEDAGEEALLQFISDYSSRHRDSGSTDRSFAEEIVSSLGHGSREIVRDWFLTPAFATELRAASSWDELKQGDG